MSEAVRDRQAEKSAALAVQSLRLGQLIDDRNTGKLGEEVIRIAQALVLCGLPYSRTDERQISRKARLGDGSFLHVGFTAGIPDIDLPFGADRKLLAWLLDKAVRSDLTFIGWDSAWRYQEEMGLSHSGKTYQNLRQSFLRLTGLAISVRRKNVATTSGENYFVFERYNLPRSIVRVDGVHPSDEPLGVTINAAFHKELRAHSVAVPRALWRQPKGNSQVHDMVLWLYFRCYSANSESVIPWDSLADQFSRDSNPRRQRTYAREAITILRRLWPGCRVEAISTGILVDKAPTPLLADDPLKNRFRLIKTNPSK